MFTWNRALILGASIVLAFVLLAVVILAGPTINGTSNLRGAPPSVDPIGSLGNWDPNATSKNPIGHSQGLYVSHINERGQTIEIAGKTSTPKPHGLLDVEWPGARIHLTPFRVLEIRSRQGSFIAPDQKPRSGEFRDGVVLTLFESAPNQLLDLSAKSHDIRLRLFMDEAKFDLERGLVESLGKIHLTTPQVDFHGTGLTLNYNEVRSRIEHLFINEGKELRIKPNSGRTPGAGNTAKPAASQPGAATQSSPPTFYRATFDKQVSARAGAIKADGDKLVVIFTFVAGGQDQLFNGLSRDSRVMEFTRADSLMFAPGLGVGRLAALRLTGLFVSQVPSTPAAGAPGAPGAPGTPGAGAESRAGKRTIFVDYPLPEDESLTPVNPAEDVTINWVGGMTVDPEENPSPELRGPDDSILQMEGRPVTVTREGDLIKAARLDYLTSTGRVRLDGSEAYPMVLDSHDLGVLRGLRLIIDQSTGTGQIPGAGSLRGHGEPGMVDAMAPQNPLHQAAGLPRGMTVAWGTQLDLTFFMRTPRGSGARGTEGAQPPLGGLSGAALSSGGLSLFRGVKDVSFKGEVEVQHPQFAMQADNLALALNDPENGRQSLDKIAASGNVRVAGKGEGDRSQIQVRSQQLTVDMARDAKGGLSPTQLHARGDVHAEQVGRKISAGLLDVALASPYVRGAPDTQPGDAGAGAGKDPRNKDPRLAVRTMHAQESVVIELADPATRIYADRVDANVPSDQSDQLELHGTPGQPARLLTDTGTLVGDFITLATKSQTAHVTGPGSFEYVSAPPRRPVELPATQSSDAPGRAASGSANAGGDAANAARKPNIVTVTWKEAMHFDNRNGTAQFVGGVESDGRIGKETTRLTAEDLHIDFMNESAPGAPAIPARGAGVAELTPGGAEAHVGGSPDNPLLKGARSVRLVTARGDVHFRAQSWLDEGGDNVASRLTIDGPILTFDNLNEQLQVVGKGAMLVEDYRPTSAKVETEPAQSAPLVNFSGRGRTLITWTGQLTMDVAHNDMLVEKEVHMLYQKLLEQKPSFQLDCRRFVADLESTGGLGVWLSGKATQPSIKSVVAEQDVRVLSESRRITADHLDYNGATQVVTLRADPGNTAEIRETEGGNAPATAQEFGWDLKHDRITIHEPGRSAMPVGGGTGK